MDVDISPFDSLAEISSIGDVFFVCDVTAADIADVLANVDACGVENAVVVVAEEHTRVEHVQLVTGPVEQSC